MSKRALKKALDDVPQLSPNAVWTGKKLEQANAYWYKTKTNLDDLHNQRDNLPEKHCAIEFIALTEAIDGTEAELANAQSSLDYRHDMHFQALINSGFSLAQAEHAIAEIY